MRATDFSPPFIVPQEQMYGYSHPLGAPYFPLYKLRILQDSSDDLSNIVQFDFRTVIRKQSNDVWYDMAVADSYVFKTLSDRSLTMQQNQAYQRFLEKVESVRHLFDLDKYLTSYIKDSGYAVKSHLNIDETERIKKLMEMKNFFIKKEVDETNRIYKEESQQS